LIAVSVLGELRINIPNGLHQTLREKAVSQKKPLKELVIEILKKAVEET
jgi:predicted HicB family RNase H-like nuclease